MNKDEIEKALYDVFFDSAIVRHGFASFLRDYDVLIEINGRQFLFRFTHCVSAVIKTSVGEAAWKESWDDVFTNEEQLTRKPDARMVISGALTIRVLILAPSFSPIQPMHAIGPPGLENKYVEVRSRQTGIIST